MAVMTVEVQEVPGRWAEILSLTEAGAEVLVTEGGVPRARLLPLAPGPARVPGLHAGALRPADDFDAPLFDRAITRSSDKLARLAEEALTEHRAGLTQELDPERL